MTTLLTLPIVLPLATGGVLLLVGRWPRLQRALSVAGAAALLAACLAILALVSRDGIQAAQMGGWPAPFGITLVADLLAAIMLVLGAIMGFAVTAYSLASMDPRHESFGYHPLLHILLMGVSGAFLTGDIFNLYVWYEVMLMASFVLLVLGGERPQVEGGLKYVALNLVASGLFLAAVGLIYGMAGSLNMADLAGILPEHDTQLVTAVSLLFLVAFGIKAGLFPLFFWLPASYHTPPVAVSAIFAGLLTKVGVYSLIRVFTLIFTQDVPFTHTIILVISGLTMVTGVLGAMAQNEFRRILSFHIISQIGYMTMGLGLFTAYGLAGSVLYIIHHIIVKTNLFLVSGIAHRRCGTYELKGLGGLYRADPLLAGLFLISALSLAGMPPLSGFFAKLALVRAALGEQSYAITAVALAVGLLTLLSMMKIWTEAFWKAAPDGRPAAPIARRFWWFAPVAGLAALTLAIGGGAEFVFALSLRTAEQLLSPGEYVRAVLGVAR
jgi:multicomponent Na+:H+ antiporter subunit D